MILLNKQFVTLIIKLGKFPELENTVVTYNKVCQEIIDYGIAQKTFNKNKLHYGTYKMIREKYSNFNSAMIQTARDQAGEIVKRTLQSQRKLSKPIKNSHSGIRYDRRSLSVMFDKNTISISTTFGRIKLPFKIAEYYSKYKDWKYSNAQLIRRKDKNYYLNLQMQYDIPKKVDDYNTLGIDCGIKNIAVLSNNTFFNSKHLRNIKGKYKNLKRELQSKGTKSAKKKLRIISGKENRFVRDVNHCISKKIVNTEYTVFAIENLKNIRQKKRYNKKLNYMIGNWSFGQFQTFLEYKARMLGKSVVQIRPEYTSQQCSKCSYTDKENRVGNIFKCKQCNFELHADLNASRNIARIGRTDFLQGKVNNPNVAHNETKVVECSDKPPPEIRKDLGGGG